MPIATPKFTDSPPRLARRTEPPPTALRRVLRSCTVALATAGMVGGLVSTAQADPDGGPTAPVAADRIEPFARYQPQSTCDPSAKPGTLALANMLLGYYDAGRSGGIVRACHIGGRSEHKEGRAFDWMLDVNRPAERAVAEQFIDWLLDKGSNGEKAYHARRLGVMYVIWNGRIWSASHAERGWRKYRGPNPHTDHIHISLAWAGAMQQTSFWTGVPADVRGGTDDRTSDPADADDDDKNEDEDDD